MSARVARLPDPALFSRGPVARLLAAIGGEGEDIKIAGGAVRNALLGEAPADIDCATTTTPDETVRRAERAGFRTIATGIEHGTVTVLVDRQAFEVTTLRADVATDGRRAVVKFGRDFAADAARRDFTINALYADADGVVTDHVGGLYDLAARRVRFIGDPETRIREDYLRILRLFRFHATYGAGDIDRDALLACMRLRDGLDILSRERVRGELMKLLVAPRAVETLRTAGEAGVLSRILGGVAVPARLAAGVAQRAESAALRLGLLAVECRDDAERLRERLALSNDEAATLATVALVGERLRGRAFALSRAEMKNIVYRHGAAAAATLAARTIAAGAANDIVATAGDVAGWTVPAFPWRGADALAAGLAPGPAVGAALARAERLWIDADFPLDPADLDRLWRAALNAAPAADSTRGSDPD